ncbi:hypothetical protein S7711_10275 [Stachybotrys chartarum IBT 7711]|uniref:Thioesterase domain-containing protein n=1 Tax=Stachybotrys chartarum (strain CBS 109288 / IBT 7711) TaxID=1280523 RepID=A0A084AF52_STACB|nr:hypothetical protein S7711_10275 [Stachybotrys chartarum IBT 7711]
MESILKEQIDIRQIAPDTYTASWHVDWTIGLTLHGGCVAAVVHHAAATHLVTDPRLAVQNQPDILNTHLEFLRRCTRHESTIIIVPLKIGAATSTILLQLSQNGQTKVIALIATTNFDKSLGPTVPTDLRLLPPPKPVPKFNYISAHKPDNHWLPSRLVGEIIPLTGRMLTLNPHGGHPVAGICDAWNGFVGHERMDATYLALMTDLIPSMYDTLLRNNGLYDAHALYIKMEQWAEHNPGVPAVLPNTISEAMRASTINATIALDIQFKRRLPKEGLDWMFTRTSTKMLQGERMDVEVTICNKEMELICTSHQLILVVEAQRKFPNGKPEPML